MMATTGKPKRYTLFGGDEAWNARDWTASDDRVRGGKSQSYLDTESDDKIGRFHGNLDIKTLGGAGFASQRTTGDDREWDLSDYAGIQIRIAKGDKKRYTFNLKDELLPIDPDTGREQSTVSYEVDFELPPQAEPGHAYDRNVFLPWSAFNATYRGKPKKDAKKIDLKKIKRVSIMMRSFFGTQEGDFSLSIRSIAALPEVPSGDRAGEVIDHGLLEKGMVEPNNDTRSSQPYRSGPERELTHMPGRDRIAYLVVGAMALFTLYYMYGGQLVGRCR